MAALLVPLASLVLTALCAGLAVAPGPIPARRVLGSLLCAGWVLFTWSVLPADRALRGILLVAGGLNVLGNLVTFELCLRRGFESLRAYVWDVLTLASSRLVPALRDKAPPGPLASAGRAVLLAAVTAGAVVLLRRTPERALPLVVWTYLKLHVVGLGAQALSDLVVALTGGRAVPPLRFPALSTSYLDFWGHRYNLWVHGVLLWVARDLMGLARRPVLLVTAAFLLSGALHEVLSYAALEEVHGWWGAFWVVQLLLTFASVGLDRALRRSRWRKPLGVAFVHVTLALSAPLFFAVFDRSWNPFGPVTPAPW